MDAKPDFLDSHIFAKETNLLPKKCISSFVIFFPMFTGGKSRVNQSQLSQLCKEHVEPVLEVANPALDESSMWRL